MTAKSTTCAKCGRAVGLYRPLDHPKAPKLCRPCITTPEETA